jgi:hypothetical protein
MNKDPLDHKNLIREAYNIEGIAKPECRSIFLDWALSLPAGQDSRDAIKAMLDKYSESHPVHPMTEVLSEGLEAAKAPRRRGGWRSRERS